MIPVSCSTKVFSVSTRSVRGLPLLAFPSVEAEGVVGVTGVKGMLAAVGKQL